MDSEQLEAWYDEEKDILTEDYNRRLTKANVNSKENLKKWYLHRLNSLHAEYEYRSNKTLKQGLTLHNLNFWFKIFQIRHLGFIDRFKEKYTKEKKE